MHPSSTKKGKEQEPLARKSGWQRRFRHQSRVEKSKAYPRIKEGKPLDDLEDERAWMDW